MTRAKDIYSSCVNKDTLDYFDQFKDRAYELGLDSLTTEEDKESGQITYYTGYVYTGSTVEHFIKLKCMPMEKNVTRLSITSSELPIVSSRSFEITQNSIFSKEVCTQNIVQSGAYSEISLGGGKSGILGGGKSDLGGGKKIFGARSAPKIFCPPPE